MIIRESFAISPSNIFLPTGRSIKDELTTGGNFPGAAPDTLLVKVAGTHGGFVNHNGFFYKQSGMQVAYLTWTQPYQKTVLTNHDEFGTPIGRVIDAKFAIDSPDFYRSKFGVTTNAPTCHIDLILSITDKESVGKVLRGEFLTVSQSSICHDIQCSVCGADILSEERCDHMRNSKVDGNRVHWIFGPLTYKELSFVNIPSDEYAKIEQVGLEKEEVADSWPSDANESYGTLVIMDSIKEQHMPKQKSNSPECGNKDYSTEDLEMIKQLDGDIDIFFDVLSDMLPDGIADKKLTAEERKALPASAFCGPDRSFPVNDCGHVTAARARIKGYKGSGNKTKILACVDAAAKKLKCFKEQDQFTLEDILAVLGLNDSVIPKSDHEDITKKLRDELEVKIKTLEDEKVAATDKVAVLERQEKESLAVHIADLKQAMGSIQEPDRHTAMVEEMKGRSLDSLTDTLKDLREENGARALEPVTDPAADTTKDSVPEISKTLPQFKDRSEVVRHLIFGPKQE